MLPRSPEGTAANPLSAPGAAQRRKRRQYRRNLLRFALAWALAGALFLVYVGHPYFLARGWAHPGRLAVCCATPADRGLAYEDVALTTADGLVLRGWYVPGRNRAAVVLTHGLASNRLGVLDHAAMLARHGYGVLLLDLRAHGESDGEILTFGGDEAEDVRAAVLYLQGRPDVDPGRIGAMGLSLGAQVSLLAAARSEAIGAVVADGPCCTAWADWPRPASAVDWLSLPYDWVFFQVLPYHTGVTNPRPVSAALAELAPRPVLLIDGGEGRHVRRLAEVAGSPPNVRSWLIPEGGHIDGLARQPDEYERLVIEFLDGALLGH